MEINKYQIKTFVHDVILMFRGTAAKLAEAYGKSEFWISDILSPTSETDGFYYPALLFMKRLHERSPEAHAILDDEWRRINDGLRTPKGKGNVNETVDTQLGAVSKAYIELLSAYRNRQGKDAIKAQTAILSAKVNGLLQTLEPPKHAEIPSLKVAKR